MITGAKDLLSSERGTFALLVVIASTVLVLTGHLSADEWLALTKWITVALVASKTVTSAVETISSEQTNREAIKQTPAATATVVKEGPSTQGGSAPS